MSTIFNFEIKGAKKNKIFQFIKGCFLINASSCGYGFWRIFRDLCKTSNKYNFAVFFKIKRKL